MKKSMPRILVVDDDRGIRSTLRDILEMEKYEVQEAVDGLDCLVKIKQSKYDVIILDVKMPKMDGMEVIEKIQSLQPDLPVVMISGHGNIDTAVESVKKGAFDFIQKPPDLNRLLITIRNAQDKSCLITEKKVLQRKISKKKTIDIVGESEAINQIHKTIELVAPTDARVLIHGENGTGKELVARWIHEKSGRNDKPLIEVNCAAIPSELIESELFGHEKGSFTSAHKSRAGKFELAHEGTLFLDEIGDMSLSAQAKVLRALQENRITRVGGDKEIAVNVRVIAATNKDLKAEIAKGNFREDLYHRLAVIIVKVPSLRDRRTDIPLLVEHFTRIICSEYSIPEKKFASSAIKELQKHNWSGNIRELRNVVERLIILSGSTVKVEEVMQNVPQAASPDRLIESLINKYGSLQEIQSYIKKAYQERKGAIA